MCGFAGLLNRVPGDPARLRSQAATMAASLRHRGPDDDGCWVDAQGRAALAFRRLSILDLSAAGHQPMVSASGKLAMVFNGEVYSFQSIRQDLVREGATFRGHSDTEVVLTAFERWGVERTLPRTIGMFAIALWDDERGELTLIRDRLGIKPLYVARTDGGLAFGSELKALMNAPGLDRSLDPSGVRTYLRYLYVPAPRTPLRSVQKLPPGHFLRVSARDLGDGIPPPRPYWSVEEAAQRGEGRRSSGNPGEMLEELEELLTDAVRMRMIADVPVGALLSGGIDSSLVVALMQKHTAHPVKTYTIGFDRPEHDESSHARAVAAHLGTDHTDLMLTADDAMSLVPSFPSIFDEPLANPSQIPTYLVSGLARREVTVALAGDGGDELFAGYNRYTSGRSLISLLAGAPRAPRRVAASMLRRIPAAAWDRLYAGAPVGTAKHRLVGQKVEKVGRLLVRESAASMYQTLLSAVDDPERMLSIESGDWDPVLEALPDNGTIDIADMQLVDQRYYLPDDLLQKVDRASMAVSLEVRVPLLDHRIVEFSWTVPEEMKIREGASKWPLRQLLHRHVPRELVERPKTGFTVPVESWLRGSLRPWAEDLLNGLPRDSLFDRNDIDARWRAFLGGYDGGALALWAVLVLESWRRHWNLAAA